MRASIGLVWCPGESLVGVQRSNAVCCSVSGQQHAGFFWLSVVFLVSLRV
jgi:hypothetical protein